MPPSSVYHPVWFYCITILPALAACPLAAYWSKEKAPSQRGQALLLMNLCVPCVTALIMIFASHNEVLKADFWNRLFIFSISPKYLLMILFLMPCVILLSTGLSLFLGYSANQFSITKEFSVMKGSAVLGIVLPLLLAPLLEELGWRGYGVDSLRAYFNLFTTSALFGLTWGVWHLPLFFMKGYYHNQLRDLGILYVINFFVSVFMMSILMNWVYYKTGRSIPALILFHSCLNLFSMLFNTKPFTKCLATVLLTIISIVVIIFDYGFFFRIGPL